MGKLMIRLETSVHSRLKGWKRERGGRYRAIVEAAIGRHHQRLIGAENKSAFIAQLAAERRHAEKMPYRRGRRPLGTELTAEGHAKLHFCAQVQGASESIVVNQALTAFLGMGPARADGMESLKDWIRLNSPLCKAEELREMLATRNDED